MTERGEGENNRVAEKERDGWRRKGARPQQSSGRFQLVMETGVAHLAAVVTDLTCPPDIHSQSSFSSALQLQNHCPSPLPPSSSSPSISLNLHSFILNSFCVLILRLLFSCSVPVSAFPSSTFSSYPLILFPFSLLPFSPSDS